MRVGKISHDWFLKSPARRTAAGLITLALLILFLPFFLSAQEQKPPKIEYPKGYDRRLGDPERYYLPEGESPPTEEQWAKAEPPINAPRPEISPEQIAVFITGKFGIPPKSKIVYRFLDLIKNWKTGPTISKQRARIKTKPGIIKHLKFSDGILLPAEEELHSPELTAEEVHTIRTQVLEGRKKAIEEMKKRKAPKKVDEERANRFVRQFQPKTLQPCLDDKVQRYKNRGDYPSEVAEKKQDLQFDILFLKESAPQVKNLMTSEEELFGTQTKVEYYSDVPTDGPSLTASRLGIECLPFRLRATKRYIYRYYGELALRNYDDPKKKKGLLHPAVKARLKQFF